MSQTDEMKNNEEFNASADDGVSGVENAVEAEGCGVKKETEPSFQPLDLRISSTGKFAALKASARGESGDPHHIIIIFNLNTGKKVFEHQEASITHMEWHPVYNKLLFIGVLSGLNAVEVTDDGNKDFIEGIVKHSILFLEYFHFSSKGKCAGYLLRNISVIPESAELKEKNIRNIILDEEKAQMLFYEKADSGDRIEKLGRAWNWIGDDTIIYAYQGEIFLRDIVWNSKNKVASFDEFIMDFIPLKNNVLIVSIDYENLLHGAGNFNVNMLDAHKGEIKPVKIEGDFIPEIIEMGTSLIFNRKQEGKYLIARFEPETGEETHITPPEEICKFPRPKRGKIYFLHGVGQDMELCRMDPSGGPWEKLVELKDFFPAVG